MNFSSHWESGDNYCVRWPAWTRAHTNLRPRFGLFIDLTLFSVDGFWATKLIMLRPLRRILNLFTALNKQTNKHLEAGAGRSFRLTK